MSVEILAPRVDLPEPAPAAGMVKTPQPSYDEPMTTAEISRACDTPFVEWVAAGNLPS